VDSVSGKTFETYNPANGHVLANVSEAEKEDVDRAVLAAKTAFEEGPWSEMSALERGTLMHRLADLIEENTQELAEIVSLDNGKPLQEPLTVEVPQTRDMFRYFSGWTTKNVGQNIPVAGSFLNYTRHEPVGVVGQIIPWNFPISMLSWKIGPALATGCTVVLKPAEQTPLAALYFAKLVKEAGFPDGVVNIIPGFGKPAGDVLVKHPDVNKIAFTGSTATGTSIMKEAANTMKRVTLELGGKSPNIVLPDADLEKTIPGVFSGIMANQGEVCNAGSRVYVHREIYDEVINGLVDYAKDIKLGSGLDPNTDMGPLISKEQQEKVIGYIEQGNKDGAKRSEEHTS